MCFYFYFICFFFHFFDIFFVYFLGAWLGKKKNKTPKDLLEEISNRWIFAEFFFFPSIATCLSRKCAFCAPTVPFWNTKSPVHVQWQAVANLWVLNLLWVSTVRKHEEHFHSWTVGFITSCSGGEHITCRTVVWFCRRELEKSF